ncbi:MAG: hypothetical protein AAGG59_15120 [Bacteroidota bacterium]
MKAFFVLILFFFFTVSAVFAQDDTDSDDDEVTYVRHRKERHWNRGGIKTLSGRGYHSGGFGAISFRASEFQDETIVMAGFRGGWIVNRTLALGFEGHGIIPTAEFDEVLPGRNAILLGGYGGMFLEPILFSNEVVHVTFPIAGGAGWLGYHDDWENDNDSDFDEIIDDDVFWYLEPGIGMEINVARHFRVAIGVTKRFTQDLELEFSREQDFENINYFLTLKFGRF